MSLSDDILWLIFMLNAIDSSEEKDNRLTTTRFSSQVCRLWRDVILQSPTMWGRLILISYRQKEEWMEEMIKRAGGTSLLWVQLDWSPPEALPLPHHYTLPSAFLRILIHSWERVEVLNVELFLWREGTRLAQQFWKLIAKPAPALRSFKIWAAEKTLPADMFGRNAPLLTSLSCETHRISHNYTFLSRINCLNFQPQSIDNLYDVLSWTPHVNVLQIAGLYARDLSDAQCSKLASMSAYILPRLVQIRAYLSFNAFKALWSTKSAYPGEIFTENNLTYRGTTLEMLDAEFQEAVENLFHYHGVITNDIHDIKLDVMITKRDFSVSLTLTSHQMRLSLYIDDIPRNILETALDYFMTHMQNIVFIHLCLPAGDKPFEKLAQACLSMNKVHTITVNRVSLRLYNRTERLGSLLFPDLTTIKWTNEVIGQSDIKDMAEFIQRRITACVVLPMVTIVKHKNIKNLCDGLDKLHGLRIIWDFDVNRKKVPVREYICGQSETLEW